jgi:hypothetical protein
MTDSRVPDAKRVFRAWTWATLVGWLVGIPSIIVFALVGEAIGLGGRHVMIGAGMGVSLGILQGRMMRRLIGRARPWFLSCAVGLASAFAVSDVVAALGWTSPYRLHLVVIGGGIVLGIWQALILGGRVPGAWTWVPASVLGWGAAAGGIGVADALFRARALGGASGALTYLGLVSCGGLLLGIITGVALVRLLNAAAETGLLERATPMSRVSRDMS